MRKRMYQKHHDTLFGSKSFEILKKFGNEIFGKGDALQ